ncbi:MAG: hypothetical protein M3010_03820, partial [Candidatus Dormibacteraeota bacterium]|nr:hypothetical protein [Candidatus Dormibacteraeota bacterium]
MLLPVTEGVTGSSAYREVDEVLDGALRRAEKRGFKGGFAAVAVIDTMGRLPTERVALLGLGDPGVVDRTRLNNALEMGLRQTGPTLARKLALAWTDVLAPQVKAADLAAAAVESAVLAAFTEATHKSVRATNPTAVTSITLAGFPRVPVSALERSLVLAEETLMARGLVNQPALELYPEAFAAIARKRARAVGLGVDVLDHRELQRRAYGAIVAVGMSSSRPPRLVVLRHGASKRPSTKRPRLALVGKGVTFDTG